MRSGATAASRRRRDPGMADVFISYSRRDGSFVRRLASSIEGQGKQVWIDTEGIEDAEVFPEAIRRAIERSDAFLFVITPAAVESAYCENEVEYASELKKRIVPVLRDPVPDSELPPEIRDRNWIPFTERDEFEPAMERLVSALDRNLEHAREHTRWLVKAIEWDGEGRDRSFLLRGSELKAAEAWLAAASDDTEPAPTPLQREYLLASREAAARRQRALVGASLAVAVISIGLLVFALISRGQAITAQAVATSRALAAQSENEIAVDPELSILLAMPAVRSSPTPDALFALRAAIDASPLRMTLLRPAQVRCQLQAGGPNLAYDPNAPLLAEGVCSATPGPGTRGPLRGRLLIFDTSTGRVVLRGTAGRGGAPVLAYTPDGSVLAAASGDGFVQLLDPRTGAVRGVLGAPPVVVGRNGPGLALSEALSFSPDGSLLTVVTQFQAKVWSVRRHTATTLEGTPVPTGPQAPALWSAAFTRDGRSVVVVGSNGARVFDARTGALRRVLPGTFQADAVAVSPDGKQVAVAATPTQAAGVVSLWSTRTWRQTGILASFPSREITALAYTGDGNDVVIGAADGSAGLWSVQTRAELVPYVGSTSRIATVALAPSGQQVATASVDGTTKVWRASGPQEASVGARGTIDDVRLVGSRLVAAIDAGVVRSWLMPSLQPQPPILERVAGAPNGFFLSPSGTLSMEPFSSRATGNPVGVSVRSTTTGALVRTVPAIPALSMLAASPDGRLLAMLGDLSALVSPQPPSGPPLKQGAGEVVALASGASADLQVVGGNGQGVSGCLWNAAAISRDDRLVAAADFCGLVALWNARTGRLRATFNNGGEPSRIAFSPNGRYLAVASWNSTITIWDVHTRRALHVLAGHTLGVDGVAYSPDGRLLASVGLDDTLRVWDPSSGRVLRVWREQQPVSSVAFNSDGHQIVTGDATGTISIWDACTACGNAKALLAIARTRVTRQLTALERTTFGVS
jgi:WD40 repeat protein